MSKNIQFIFNSSELGAGTRGASLGPEAIRAAARAKGSTLFSQFKIRKVAKHNDLLDHPTSFRYAKYIDGLGAVFESLSEEIQDVVSSNALPFILAGDHSAAAGTLAALKKAYPQKRIGVIWIDAHADIHSPYTTPSGNIHGMPIAAALGLDHKHLAKNVLDVATAAYWDKLKSNAFLAQDLVYIGVRDTEAEENTIMQELHLRNYSVKELRQKGLAICLQEITDKLMGCELIYVSFDVDSIDPIETSYGTGTPVPNGLLLSEANELLNFFAKDPRLCALEIVEVNPCLDDQKNKMAEHALELIENIIAQRTV